VKKIKRVNGLKHDSTFHAKLYSNLFIDILLNSEIKSVREEC
jgi:hypothetical protein